MQVTSVLVHSNSKLGIPNSYWQLIYSKIKILCFLINCRTLIKKKKDSFGRRCQLFETLVSANKKQKKSLHTMLFAFRVATDRISETQAVLQCILSPDFQKNLQVSLAHNLVFLSKYIFIDCNDMHIQQLEFYTCKCKCMWMSKHERL